jgi:alpha/beta superfamily hydrolase
VSVEYEHVVLEALDGVVLHGEALLPPAPVGAAVVCHPHPLYGGDMNNNVVVALVRALSEAGIAALRFDFRGAGRSGGEHGDGETERLDVVAAIDVVAPYVGDGPLLLAGYSFGAAVALSVADPRLDGWFVVAPPLAMPGRGNLIASTDHRPKRIQAPEHDQFTPPAAMDDAVAGWTATTVELVPMADHFMAGATALVAERAVAFTRTLAGR